MSIKSRFLFAVILWLTTTESGISQNSKKASFDLDSLITQTTNMLNPKQITQAKIRIDSLISLESGSVSNDNLLNQLKIRSLLGRYFLVKPDLAGWTDLYAWIKGKESICKTDQELVLLIKLLNNAGVAFKRNLQLSDSEEAYLKASEILRRMTNPDYFLYGSVYVNAGNSLKQIGEFERSIEYFEQGIQNFDIYKAKGQNPDTLRRCIDSKSKALDNLGLVYQSLGNHKKAIEVLRSSIDIKLQNNPANIVNVYTNLVISLIEDGNYTEAQSILVQILNQYQPGVPIDEYWALAELNLIDITHRVSGDSEMFLFKLDQLIKKIQLDLPTAVDIVVVAKQMAAMLLLNLGKCEQALTKLAEAMQAMSSNDQVINPFDIPYHFQTLKSNKFDNKFIELMNLNAQAYLTWGNQLKDIGKLKSSEERYDFTLKLIDSLRNSLELQSSKIQVSNMQRSTYNQMIELEYQIFQLTGDSTYISRLFNTMEQSKSAGLWSSVKNIDLKNSQITPEDLNKESTLRKKITDIEGSIIEASSAQVDNKSVIKRLQEQKIFYNQQIDSMILVYRQKYPDYFKAKFDRSIISIKQVGNLLQPDQVFIEYALAFDYLYTLTATRSGTSITRIPFSQKAMEDITFMLDFMKGHVGSLTGAARSRYCDAASGLYELLIGPLESLIRSKELLIIPDGLLSYIPFEALLESKLIGPKQDYRKLPYLIRNHSVSYGLTATVFFYKSNRTGNPTRRVLAVAPKYDMSSGNISDYIRKAQAGLPELTGTYEESKAIKKMLGGRLLTGSKATESKFKSIGSKYSILHLAMHSISDKNNSLNSSLVFTPGADKKEDGVLFGHEVYNLSLNAWLTVLSACETGSGQMESGEGILSFGRAFIVAGCPNLIMTLWTVDDRSSREIMVNFYQSLISGSGIADALQKSKLDYLEHVDQLHAHPHYWAGFIELGQNQVIKISRKKTGLLYLFLFSSITILIIALIQSKRNPRRSGDMMEME